MENYLNTITAELLEKNSSLQIENDNLLQNITTLKEDTNELKLKKTDIEIDINKIQQEHSNKETQLLQLTDTLQKYEDAIQVIMQIDEYKEISAKLAKEINQLNESKSVLQEETTKLKNELEETTSKCSTLNKDKELLSKECVAITETLNKLKEDHESVKNNIQIATETLVKTNQDIENSKLQGETKNNEEIERLNKEILSLTEKTKDINSNQQNTEKLSAVNKQLEEIKGEYELQNTELLYYKDAYVKLKNTPTPKATKVSTARIDKLKGTIQELTELNQQLLEKSQEPRFKISDRPLLLSSAVLLISLACLTYLGTTNKTWGYIAVLACSILQVGLNIYCSIKSNKTIHEDPTPDWSDDSEGC